MSQTPHVTPSLYGLKHSNRSADELWGKNQFNSTFPASLACYMRDQQIPVVYLTLSEHLLIEAGDLQVSELFNTTLPNDQLRFHFESRFQPYEKYAFDKIGGIDLVVRHLDNGADSWRRPLEVKLTVVPDNSTCKLPPDKWSPELVIRPATTKYCALGMYDACKEDSAEIREIFEEFCGNVQSWASTVELQSKLGLLLKALNAFQSRFHAKQQPFLLQPIWKTEGKAPALAPQAFDIFVWSDFALCRAFISFVEKGATGAKINRPVRAAARLARILYTLASQGKANLGSIYTEMAHGKQTDKEFALNGKVTKDLMSSVRRTQPILHRDVISQIVRDGGESLLSPERRFDATIFFAANELFRIGKALDARGQEQARD